MLGTVPGQVTSDSTANTPLAAFDLVARIPVLPHTFIDADVPIGVFGLGNPMVGMHHVFRPADPFWITLGGAFGFPLVNNASFESFAFANGLWDAERFMAQTVPFAIRFGLEGHAGILELRAELDPVWGVSISSSQAHYFAFQHAFEIQIGHAVGGGLRYQGVAVGTKNDDIVGVNGMTSPFLGATTTSNEDHYQGVLEPFFRLYHDPIFLRLGLQMPIDKPLGPPFASGWGFKGTVGFSVD
jgi:hypothetical protein